MDGAMGNLGPGATGWACDGRGGGRVDERCTARPSEHSRIACYWRAQSTRTRGGCAYFQRSCAFCTRSLVDFSPSVENLLTVRSLLHMARFEKYTKVSYIWPLTHAFQNPLIFFPWWTVCSSSPSQVGRRDVRSVWTRGKLPLADPGPQRCACAAFTTTKIRFH